jgi:hypothetical protein
MHTQIRTEHESFQAETASGKGPDLNAFVQKTSATLGMYLKMAEASNSAK